MPSTAPQIPDKTASEVRNCIVSFAGKLDSGELLTGTPTVTASPSGLTIANVIRNSTSKTVNGVSISASQGVQWKVSGGTAGTTYTFTITCGTDATPAQTLIGYAKMRVSNA